MFATILPLVGLTYHGRARARAFAVWGTVAGASGAVGTLSGGLLAQLLGWRWIFLAPLPVCVAAVVLAVTSLTDGARTGTRVDPAGIGTFTLAATALTYAVINGATAAGPRPERSSPPWSPSSPSPGSWPPNGSARSR
ncbi:MFS transporter [Streptantibioticus cattleyicolor]|uniref:MFS transporter n=1 Tax=Streptantibioticus cattleyicolor TaxID=29303 RepID=UPI000213DDE8|nr:MFS transporter [Streptantibioticus cattleyicolor]CCB71625.1 putative drug resistance transporter [Streptantibioticus cattleyicolor NRRL 8057 = DSM 46488]